MQEYKYEQEAELSQKHRAIIPVVEYFTSNRRKLSKVNENDTIESDVTRKYLLVFTCN